MRSALKDTLRIAAVIAAILFFTHSPVLAKVTAAINPHAQAPLTLTSAYMETSNNQPVAWSTCAPINYVVNFHGAPSFAAKDLALAISRLAAVTGYRFVFTGTTSEVPTSSWSKNQQLGRAGWAPLIISFGTPNQTDMLHDGPSQFGDGSPAWVNGAGGPVYVSGAVVINAEQHFQEGFGAGTSLGTLFMHEIGHVLGLAHSTNPASFMYPYLGVTAQTITPLDLVHLRALVARGCPAVPTAGW